MNIGSVEGVSSFPLQSAYSAAKHGMLGFSCSLREELMSERYKGMDIEVVDILPSSMDTQLHEHAKSVTGKYPRPMPPIYDPMMTIKSIIRHAKRPKALVIVGGSGKMMATMPDICPPWGNE